MTAASGRHTFVIAEMGSSHDGDFGKALGLIAQAKMCGADAVKAQYWSSARKLARRRHAPEYLAVYKKYQLPRRWLKRLKAECDQVGIEFMCTVYLPEDIKTIAPLVQRFKVASFEAGDDAFVSRMIPYGKGIIISTGMAEEFPRMFTVLHCVSSYPTPIDQANLAAIWDERCGGYSDHTARVETGMLAVAAGARILEVHFRLVETRIDNPDFAVSLSPGSLYHYIANVRLAEKMMGDGIKRPQPCEAEMMKYRVRP